MEATPEAWKARLKQSVKKIPAAVALYNGCRNIYWDIRRSYKRLTRNRISWQRRTWSSELAKEDPHNASRLGFHWGDPESAETRLGDYLHILNLLREEIKSNPSVLEIGSYGGKWTQHMKGAKKIICVDLFETSFDFLRQRLGKDYNLEFYKTRGDELEGIPSESVDLVFSIDCLVRAPKRAIRRYISEIYRVLACEGRLILHLPCKDSPYCRGMYFTVLSRSWIEGVLLRAGFRHFEIDTSTLKHGVLVTALKDRT